MRIIFCLAAALGAAATAAAAAPAGPGGAAFHGGGARPGWSKGGGDTAGGLHFRYAPAGRIKGHRGHGRRLGRGGLAYGGFVVAGHAGTVEPWGNGFFTGGGGEIRLRGGRPHFDYDRSYPYEWAPASGGRRDWEGEEAAYAAERPPRCAYESGVRVCRGW